MAPSLPEELRSAAASVDMFREELKKWQARLRQQLTDAQTASPAPDPLRHPPSSGRRSPPSAASPERQPEAGSDAAPRPDAPADFGTDRPVTSLESLKRRLTEQLNHATVASHPRVPTGTVREAGPGQGTGDER